MGLAEYQAAMRRYYKGDNDALDEAMELLTPEVARQLDVAEKAAVARREAAMSQRAYWDVKTAQAQREVFWRQVNNGISTGILALFIVMAFSVFLVILAWGLSNMGGQ